MVRFVPTGAALACLLLAPAAAALSRGAPPHLRHVFPKDGQTVAAFAEDFLGSRDDARIVERLNPVLMGRRDLVLPPAEILIPEKDWRAAPTRAVAVVPGQTLDAFVRRHLRDPSWWPVLVAFNDDIPPSLLARIPFATLNVPVKLLRGTGTVAFVSGVARLRRFGHAGWRDLAPGRGRTTALPGDTLATRADSWAFVEFENGRALSVPENAQVMIKPATRDPADVLLRGGAVRSGRVRVVTSDAFIHEFSQDAVVDVEVVPGKGTRVLALLGTVVVENDGGAVSLSAGAQTVVRRSVAPMVPEPGRVARALRAMPEVLARRFAAADVPPEGPPMSVAQLRDWIRDESVRVGDHIDAVSVRVAHDSAFSQVLVHKTFAYSEGSVEKTLKDAELSPGVYWIRARYRDLLGIWHLPQKPMRVVIPRR